MDLPPTLVMSPGQTLEFELPGLGGAGYLWFAEVSANNPQPDLATCHPGTAVVAVTLERGKPTPPGSDDGQPRVGAALPENLHITAHTPGTATVHVVQRRPWEDRAPRAERHTRVVVQGTAPAPDDGAAEALDEPSLLKDT